MEWTPTSPARNAKPKRPPGIKPIVYTYFDPDVNFPHQREIITLWSKSWTNHGWHPRIIRSHKAQPGYQEFENRVDCFPTVNKREYERACYLRWFELWRLGGGFMTDYDVINFGFKPRAPKGPVEILDRTYVPCAVMCNAAGASAIKNRIYNYVPRPDEKHISDMTIFKTMFDGQAWGPAGQEVVEYGCENWDKAPLVHFSSGATHLDKLNTIKRYVS